MLINKIRKIVRELKFENILIWKILLVIEKIGKFIHKMVTYFLPALVLNYIGIHFILTGFILFIGIILMFHDIFQTENVKELIRELKWSIYSK